MKTLSSEFKDRLDHWIHTLQNDFYEPVGKLSWEMFTTMDELSLEEATTRKYTPVEPGFTWGHTWEYGWFRTSITIPECCKGKRVNLDVQADGEATIFVNGKSFGTHRAEWVHVPHHYIVDNYITTNACPGETYTIYMEVYAGHYFPDYRRCATGPVLPGSYTDPKTEGARLTLGNSTFGIWNEAAYQLYLDVETLRQIHSLEPETSLRAAKIAEALEKFTLLVDFEQDREARMVDYIKAREAIRPAMEAVNGSSAPEFFCVGNAHLDLAWLWTFAETRRKTARTFAQQLRLMGEYPEYRFIQSQPISYEMCRKKYPELFERIKAAIAKGNWIADGAMWVEPDTNMAGGEALIRQLLHGKRYYKEEFGVDSEVLWLPDTFGYTGALPQVLKSCKVKYLVTQKIFWTYNDGEAFPYHYFNWEGIDGTQIVSFLPTSYVYRTDPAEMADVWRKRSQVRDIENFLIPFGYGDGGGGPTRDDIEYIIREKNLEGTPKMTMCSPKEFFEYMDKKHGKPVNTYKGELYFTAHRGTYTSQAIIKKLNRKNELALRDMEIWGVTAASRGYEYPLAKADELWKKLLFYQFHDILPGSGIERIYQEVEAESLKLNEIADRIISDEFTVLSDNKNGVSVWNSLSFERTETVTLPKEFEGGAVTADGSIIPVTKCGNEYKATVSIKPFSRLSLFPVDCVQNEKAKQKADVRQNRASITSSEKGFILENSKLKATVNHRGEVISFIMKNSGREYVPEGSCMNRFRMFKDVPRAFDAWDIDSHYEKSEVPGAYDISVKPGNIEGDEVTLEVTGRIGQSAYTQAIVLSAEAERLEFRSKIDWKELHRLLKISFPTGINAINGINEIQFGFVERPAQRSQDYDKDRFEVCNHRYSALCDNAHGFAVLNDCKYGISMNDGELALTLLKSASSPEMRADNRVHTFTYAITAWEGSFAESNALYEGLALNVPARISTGTGEDFSLAAVDSKNIIIDTIKPAEDGSGDIIIRMYEGMKMDTSACVTSMLFSGNVYSCNMLEEVEEQLNALNGKLDLHFRPFEIKTIRITK